MNIVAGVDIPAVEIRAKRPMSAATAPPEHGFVARVESGDGMTGRQAARIAGIAAAAAAVALAVSLLVLASHQGLLGVTSVQAIAPESISLYGDNSYYAPIGDGVPPLPGLVSPADSSAAPNRSRLTVMEDGGPLGPPHSGHAAIGAGGEGRFSHWSDGNSTGLVFSASDNSDPRANGRAYAAVRFWLAPPRAAIGAAIAGALSLAALLVLLRRRIGASVRRAGLAARALGQAVSIRWPAVSALNADATRIVLLIGLLGAYAILRKVLLVKFDPADWPAYWAVALLICVAGARWSISVAPAAYRLIFRTLIGLFIFYLVMHSPAALPSERVSAETAQIVFVYGRWLAVAAGVLALFRPSFAVFTLCYVYWQKHALEVIGGMPITMIDYIAVLDAGLFLAVACGLTAGLSTWAPRLVARAEATKDGLRLLESAVLVGVALHFGNYFYSGLEKVLLNGGPFSWVLENRTPALLLAAYENGQLPISRPEALAAYTYTAMNKTVVAMNILTLAAQLAAVVAIMRARWIAVLTIFYDITHLTIFVTTGVFFWKWIIFNLVIVAAVARWTHRRFTAPLTVFLICVVLGSQWVVTIARLGWYDTLSFNRFYLTAISEDGSEHRVPSNFFGPFSIYFTQYYAGAPFTGHFGTGTYGTTSDIATMRTANACALETADRSGIAESPGRPALERLVRDYHRHILETSPNGRPAYDLFPHHIWSNPFEYGDFARLDKRTVDHYHFTVESVCVGVEGPRVAGEIKLRGEYDISLEP